jgi:hypothetical protein
MHTRDNRTNMLTHCAVLLCVGLFNLACEDREVSLVIRQAQPIVPGECEPSKAAEEGLSRGVVDIAIATNYVVYPFVENRMKNVVELKGFANSDARIDTHDVVLRAAVVEYSALDQISADIPASVRVPLSGTVPLNGNAVLGIEVLSNSMVENIRSAPEFLIFDSLNEVRASRASVQMIAKITLEGETLDGTDIVSNELVFPLEICNGCRVTFPNAFISIGDQGPVCRQPVDADGAPVVIETDSEQCAAYLGTDGQFVDCLTCQGAAVDRIARQLCQPALTP